MASLAGAAPPHGASRSLRLCFALSVGVLLWSFVAGAVYVWGVQGSFALRGDPLSGARQRAARGDVTGAAREYRAVIAIDALDTRAVFELGTLLLRSGRVDEASADLERALRAHPRDARVLATLGDVRLAQNRHREAIDLYKAAIGLSPQEPSLLNNLGTAYAGLGDLERAVVAYRASIAIKPGIADKNLARALEELQKAPSRSAR